MKETHEFLKITHEECVIGKLRIIVNTRGNVSYLLVLNTSKICMYL
jgi:hypothetical protein